MFILPNIFDIFNIIHQKDVETYRHSDSFRVFSNILKTPEYRVVPVGIPYWVLFEDENQIDMVLLFQDMNSIKYCNGLECLVFTDIIHAILGIRAIFTILYYNDKTNKVYEEKLSMIESVIKKVHTENMMGDICSNINDIHI